MTGIVEAELARFTQGRLLVRGSTLPFTLAANSYNSTEQNVRTYV